MFIQGFEGQGLSGLGLMIATSEEVCFDSVGP
jgi:hypothetical protein